mgnify:CR=1 FL=1
MVHTCLMEIQLCILNISGFRVANQIFELDSQLAKQRNPAAAFRNPFIVDARATIAGSDNHGSYQRSE